MSSLQEECSQILINATREQETVNISTIKAGLINMKNKVLVLQAAVELEQQQKIKITTDVFSAATHLNNANTIEDLLSATKELQNVLEKQEIENNTVNTANDIYKLNTLVEAYELIARLSDFMRNKTIDYKIILTGKSINPRQMTEFTLTLDELLSKDEKGNYQFLRYDPDHNSLRIKSSGFNAYKATYINDTTHPLFEFIDKNSQNRQRLAQYTAVLEAIYNQRNNIWTEANAKRIAKGLPDDYINRGNIKELFLLLQEGYPDYFKNLPYKNGKYEIDDAFENTMVNILKDKILSNTIPFYQQGDLVLNGQDYQVKGNEATVTNIKTILNILTRFIDSLGSINEGVIHRGVASKDLDSIVKEEAVKFVQQFIAGIN